MISKCVDSLIDTLFLSEPLTACIDCCYVAADTAHSVKAFRPVKQVTTKVLAAARLPAAGGALCVTLLSRSPSSGA